MIFAKSIKYIGNLLYLKKITISLFFIVQRNVKSWIIAKLQEIVMSTEILLHFERNTVKIKLQKGHFGEK
jgi:hypothetical protein